MKTKAFQDWTIQQLEGYFGLIAIKQKDNQILASDLAEKVGTALPVGVVLKITEKLSIP